MYFIMLIYTNICTIIKLLLLSTTNAAAISITTPTVTYNTWYHQNQNDIKHLITLQLYRVCNQINTTGTTSGAGTAYHSVALEFTPGSQWGSCYSMFSCMCMFCRSLFVLLSFFFWPLILRIRIKIIAYAKLYVRVGILLTCSKHRIISLRRDAKAQKNQSNPATFFY